MLTVKSKLLIAVISIAVFAFYTKGIWDYSSEVTETKINKLYADSLKEKNDEILNLKSKLATSRQEGITANEELNEEYERKLHDQAIDYENTIEQLDSDIIGLRVHLQNRERTPETGTTVLTDTQTCDNETDGAELPKETARFLISEAKRADDVIQQLTACQATVMLYIDIVNKHNALLEGLSDGT